MLESQALTLPDRAASGACAYPGCDRPVDTSAWTPGKGQPPKYCDLSDHNSQTAWRARHGQLGTGTDQALADERPVAGATATLASLAAALERDLERTRAALATLGDPAALEAELAAATAAHTAREEAERSAEAALEREEAERAIARQAELAERAAERECAAAVARAQAAEDATRAANERADRVEEQLAELRALHQAGELAHARAEVAFDAEQARRARAEQDLTETRARLLRAEKARDAAVAAITQAATRPAATRRPAQEDARK